MYVYICVCLLIKLLIYVEIKGKILLFFLARLCCLISNLLKIRISICSTVFKYINILKTGEQTGERMEDLILLVLN